MGANFEVKMGVLFAKEFLDDLEKKEGLLSLLDHYMDDLELSFHDSILEICKNFSIEPVYFDPKIHAPCPLQDENIKLFIEEKLKEIREKNEISRNDDR